MQCGEERNDTKTEDKEKRVGFHAADGMDKD